MAQFTLVTWINSPRAQPLLDEWIQYHQKVFNANIKIQYDLPNQVFDILQKSYTIECISWTLGAQKAQEHALKSIQHDVKHRIIVCTLDDFLVITDSYPEHIPSQILPRFFFRPSKRGSCILQSTQRSTSAANVSWPGYLMHSCDTFQLYPVPKTVVPDIQLATFLRHEDLFYNYDSRTYAQYKSSDFSFKDQSLFDAFVS